MIKTKLISTNNTGTRTLDAVGDAAREGRHVLARRNCWTSSVFVWLMPEADVKAEWCREPVLKAAAVAFGGVVHCAAAMRRLTGDGVETGWSPTIEDIVASDWELHELEA